MNHHSDSLWNLNLVDQYRSLADGYLFSAIATCEMLAEDNSAVTYARISSCYFNARLSVELFLKALILKRKGSVDKTHHIEILRDSFNSLYPDLVSVWDVPFCTEFLGYDDVSDAQKQFLKDYPVDQLLRYPTDRSGKSWDAVFSIEPIKFLGLLYKIKSDFQFLSESTLS